MNVLPTMGTSSGVHGLLVYQMIACANTTATSTETGWLEHRRVTSKGEDRASIQERVSEMPQELVNCELCEKDFLIKDRKSYMRFKTLCPTCYASQLVPTTKELELRELNAVASGFTKKEEYFNAVQTDLALIKGNAFERALTLKARIEQWENKLFEAQSKVTEYFVALQKLASELRLEERSQLKLSTPEYQVKPIEPRRNRISKEDKILKTIADNNFGGNLERAKEFIRNTRAVVFTKMASGELHCTCQSTPGICKIHEGSK